MEEISIVYHDKNMPKLEQIENGNWIDLYTVEDVNFLKGDFKLITLGISMKIPDGYEALVIPRSSTFLKYGILQANSVGLIDTSYCGDNDIWKFPALATRNIRLPKYTRVCQFRIQKSMDTIKFTEAESLGNNNRGGFGSTGD